MTTVARGILRVHVIPNDQQMGRHNMALPSFTPVHGIGSVPSPRDLHETRRTANIAGARMPSQRQTSQSIGEDGCSSATKSRRQCVPISPRPETPSARASYPTKPPAIELRMQRDASTGALLALAACGSFAQTAPTDRRYIFSALNPHHSLDPLHPTRRDRTLSPPSSRRPTRFGTRVVEMQRLRREHDGVSERARAVARPSPLAALGAVWYSVVGFTERGEITHVVMEAATWRPYSWTYPS
jgi:hypothetical protein